MPVDLWKRAHDKCRGKQEVARQVQEIGPSQYPLVVPSGTDFFISSTAGWERTTVPREIIVSHWVESENKWCHFELADGRVAAVKKGHCVIGPIVIDPGTPILVQKDGQLIGRRTQTAVFCECPETANSFGFIACRLRSGELIIVHRKHIR